MAGHKFELRADFRYGGDDNRIDHLEAEVLTGDGWQTLQIGNDSPGFLIFVYAFLICQHTYFHANSGEGGLLLKRAKLELSLHTGEDWLIERVSVGINACAPATPTRAVSTTSSSACACARYRSI
jgi:hypothetical protein